MTNLFTRQGSEFLVNTAKMYSQYEPQVTGLTNGGFVVTWVTEDTTQDGSGWAIKAQIFTAAGVKQGGEFLVNSAKASYQEFPTITGLANGGFVVAWQTWDATQDGSGSAIKAQVFTAAGVRQGGEFLVNTAKTSDQKFSTVTGLFNGGFVVTWSTTDPTQDGNRAAVKAQVFSAAGVKQGAELLVNTATTGDQLYSTITTLANGSFVVTWGTWDAAQDGSGTAIKAQVFTAAGVKQGSEFLVNTATGGNQYGPTVIALANGGFVVTWMTDDYAQDGSDSAIKAQIFTAAGVKQGAEFLVNTSTYGFQYKPTVTALANGGFVVNWTDSDTLQSLNSQIKAQVFDAAGVKQGGEFLVNTVAGFGDYYDTPTITGLASGGFVVAWATGDTAQDGSGTAIKAQIFQPGDFSLSVAAVQETQVANVAFAQLSGNGAYSYALVSDSTGAFAIQGDRLLVADNTRLDYETASTATLVVRATDASGLWFDKTLTLGITDASVETRYKAGSEFLVNTAFSLDQAKPTITGLANGGFVVTWETSDTIQDGDGTAIKAQSFTAAGAKQGAEFLVNTAKVGGQFTPTVTGLANGGFVVTWWTDDPAQDGSLYAIKAQVFTAAGVKQGGEFLVNTGNLSFQFTPKITGLANGGFVVAWYNDYSAQDGNGSAITAQVFTAAGAKQGAEFLVNTATTDSQLTPTITALSNGGFVVAWQTWDAAQDGNGSAIKAQLFTAAGVKQGAEFLVNTAAADYQADPTVTALSNGGFVVTWMTQDTTQDGSGYAIKAQVFTAAGVKTGAEFLVNTANMFDQRMPTITGLANGSFVVTWQTDDPAQDGNGSAIKAQVFDAAGVKQGAEFLVAAANAGNERSPTITALANGGFSVAWSTDDPAQDGSLAAIKARVFAPVNTPPVALDDVVVAGQGAVVTLPSAALLANDSDADGDALSLTSVSAAVGGSVVLANGAVTFTPTAGFVGAAGFDYVVADGRGGSDTGHVSVNVRPYLTVDDIVVNEGDAFATLTLRLSAPMPQASTVTWSTSNGRAVGTSDYLSAAAQTVTFQPGQAVQTIQIPLLANTAIEGIEEFFVNFASSALTLERSFAMVTIRDDDLADRAPVASVGDVTVDETDGTAHAVIVLDRAPSAAVTVTYRTVAVSATAGSDFTARTGSVTFAAGETVKTVGLAILNDSAAEADERFQFELTGISGVTGAVIGDGIAEITIAGNDRPTQAMPTVFVDDMVHSEGATEGYLTVSFRLNAPSAAQTSVDWSAGGGTASNADFRPFITNTLVFAAGETVRTVRIPILQDTAVERPEQFYITLSTPVGLQIDRAFATLTLVDDDNISRAPVASVGDLVLDEADGTAHFAITLDRASAVPVTVTYRTVDGTATAGSDFVARTGSVTFNPGETAKTIDVAILNDALAEGLEMFRFELTGISGVTGAVIGDGMADAVIALNDRATQATPTVIVDDMVYSEGATEGFMTVTFLLSAPSASQTSVDWLTGTGTAAGLDFSFFFASTLVFAAGETVKTVQIPILPDSLVEGTEQFSVNLANPVGLQIAKGFATMTLIDDDATSRAPIASVGDVAVNESDGLAHFAITLDRASSVPVTVTYRTVNGTATGGDFVARTGSVTFNPGETAKTVDVAIVDDATGEAAESFTLKLTGMSGVTDAAIGDGEATATIGASDGTAAATPQLSVTAIPGIEGGANVASFLFQLSAPSASATSVSFSTPNGTATGGQDFATFGTTRLTFAAGETLKLVQIPLINDTSVEATETFSLNLTNPSGMTLAATSVTNSILDNDGASVSVAVVSPELVEGTGTGARTVKLIFAREGLTTAAQSVDWAVQTRSGATVDAADFTGGVLPSGQISFAAGQSVTTVTLSIAQDSVLEPDEAFDVVLSNPTAGLKLANATTGITLLNDDVPPQATYAIAATSADKPEGNSGTTAFTFTVTRGVSTAGTGSVAWAVSGSGASPADAADFGGSLPGGTVSFAAGEVTKTVTVQVSGDTLIEADQDFSVTLSSPVSGTITTASAAGTIRNDDVPPQATYAIAAASADKPEGNSGTTAFTFTVTRGVNTTGTGSVAWAVSGSGASPADAADFGGSLPGGTVSFAAGEVTKTVTVQISGDTLAEADQGFAVTLTSPVGGTIATPSATGTIRNDDGTPGQTYNGTSANNTYAGGAGDDTIFGNGGNDTLSGGAGKDTIDGGTGKDKITGNAGADVMTGGTGADTFVFTALSDSTPALAGRDRIMDFSHADPDRIDLSALDADAGLAGNQAFVLVAEDFTGTPGEISVASWGTKRLVTLDVDGDGVADFALTVISATDLVAADFIL